MALDLQGRPERVSSPEIDVGVPSPDIKPMYTRQLSDTEYSPYDTPRKNKRKLSEPKRRTTDFSIKRLCPDSPGSACSESGRSEESTPERSSEDLRDSPGSDTSPCDKDTLHPHLRPPIVFSEMRNHPYFIPQFYYNRFPGYPGAEHLPMYPGYPGMPSVPVQPPSHTASVEHTGPVPVPGKKRNSQHNHNKSATDTPRAARDITSTAPSESAQGMVKEEEDDNHSEDESGSKDSKKCRKNYKNMTRERRVEANARERSRVHTISAAFEGLRRAVPSYSYNQKLSKLAILRIACSYINALTKITDSDDNASPSPDVQDKSFAECVDLCTRTIQTEGKARRRH